jgi:hypothetical protein
MIPKECAGNAQVEQIAGYSTQDYTSARNQAVEMPISPQVIARIGRLFFL